MPYNPDMSLLDSSLLCEFLTDCDLPATVQIVEGYDHEYEEQSWSQGEIVYLHAMKDVPQVLALDKKGNRFCIPLNYPEKIFESIPNRCGDEYKTVEELIAEFPKYVRSLGNISRSGVKVGDILRLVETSPNAAGVMELKCWVKGSTRSITLSGDQVGPFETLEDINPTTMRDVIDQHLLPTRVRVRVGTQALSETNINKRTMLEGLVTIKEIVQEKVLIVSTLVGKDLRVVKLPIDLELRVQKESLNLDQKLFTEICLLIDKEVKIESTILSGNGEASWNFDIADIKRDIEEPQADDIYEELIPPVPPRAPLKLNESNLKQNTKLKTTDSETRYAPSPKRKPPKNTASSEVQKGTEKPCPPPPVAKKPNLHKENPHHSIPPLAIANTTSTTPQNIEQHNDPPDEAVDHTGCISGTQSVSPSKPKPANKPIKTVVPKESAKPVSSPLVKPKSNGSRQTSIEQQQPPSSHHCTPPLQDLKKYESEGSPTKLLASQNIESQTQSKPPTVINNNNGPDETEEYYESIENIQFASPPKANSPSNSVSPAVSLKESLKSAPLPHGKLTPNVIKQKSEEKQLPRAQNPAPPLQNSSSFKTCESKDNPDNPTKLTSQNAESHSKAEMSAVSERLDKAERDAGVVQDKGKEHLKDISVSEVSGWLMKLGLSAYVDRFVKESIDGNFLLELDTEMMQYLGISNPLHKKKLMMFIQKGWTPKK
ncbi:uncharacterized protein LOC144651381 [Oculina patagonica]